MAQRLERVDAAGGGANDLQRTEQPEHRSERNASPAGTAKAGHTDDQHGGDGDEQGSPQRKDQLFGKDGLDDPHRHREQHDPEYALDQVHPGTSLRQQRAGRCADQQQGHAHSDSQREQSRCAQGDVAALTDEDQARGEGCRNAGTDDKGRHAAHREDAGKPAGRQALTGVGEGAGQRGRHLKLVDAEHRQRKDHQRQRKQGKHPSVLQIRREPPTGQAGSDPQPRVDRCDTG